MNLNTNNFIKKAVFLILFFTACSFAHAQSFKKPLKPHFAAKGGMNGTFLSLDNDYVEEKYGRVLPYFGLVGKFPLTREFAYRQEINMTFKGGSGFRYDIEQYEGTKDIFLTYIEAPVLFQYDFLNVLNVHAGGYAAYLIDSDISFNGTPLLGYQPIGNDDVKEFDAGITLGAGITFKETFEFGARYNHGLIDLADSDNAEIAIPETQNRSIQVYFAFWFSEVDFKKLFRQGQLKL